VEVDVSVEQGAPRTVACPPLPDADVLNLDVKSSSAVENYIGTLFVLVNPIVLFSFSYRVKPVSFSLYELARLEELQLLEFAAKLTL